MCCLHDCGKGVIGGLDRGIGSWSQTRRHCCSGTNMWGGNSARMCSRHRIPLAHRRLVFDERPNSAPEQSMPLNMHQHTTWPSASNPGTRPSLTSSLTSNRTLTSAGESFGFPLCSAIARASSFLSPSVDCEANFPARLELVAFDVPLLDAWMYGVGQVTPLRREIERDEGEGLTAFCLSSLSLLDSF